MILDTIVAATRVRVARDKELETLQQLENAELLTFLTDIDPTANSVAETGATDWADLNERLHFIADMFRCFHQSPDLFCEAFTTEQLTVLEKGELPGGRL